MTQRDKHIQHRSFQGDQRHIFGEKNKLIRKIAHIDFFRKEVTSCVCDLCYRWPPSAWR